SVTLDGETTLTELSEDYGFSFQHDAVTTLAGLVLAGTGTVPPVGARVELQGHELTVEAVDAYKLTQIRVARVDVPVDGLASGGPAPDH
ncbi:MAG: HlyC/CorC family transporter, partial [Acidimicrobiia bacterium]|nr:HlyC/CorC family transporter [Acidimicrobiia bacterium]